MWCNTHWFAPLCRGGRRRLPVFKWFVPPWYLPTLLDTLADPLFKPIEHANWKMVSLKTVLLMSLDSFKQSVFCAAANWEYPHTFARLYKLDVTAPTLAFSVLSVTWSVLDPACDGCLPSLLPSNLGVSIFQCERKMLKKKCYEIPLSSTSECLTRPPFLLICSKKLCAQFEALFIGGDSSPSMTLMHLHPATPGWWNGTGASGGVTPEMFPNVKHSPMLFRESGLSK